MLFNICTLTVVVVYIQLNIGKKKELQQIAFSFYLHFAQRLSIWDQGFM